MGLVTLLLKIWRWGKMLLTWTAIHPGATALAATALGAGALVTRRKNPALSKVLATLGYGLLLSPIIGAKLGLGAAAPGYWETLWRRWFGGWLRNVVPHYYGVGPPLVF